MRPWRGSGGGALQLMVRSAAHAHIYACACRTGGPDGPAGGRTGRCRSAAQPEVEAALRLVDVSCGQPAALGNNARAAGAAPGLGARREFEVFFSGKFKASGCVPARIPCGDNNIFRWF